ncbi:MAG: hypothetical protein U0736_27265 [Gemmataceae bacterium]
MPAARTTGRVVSVILAAVGLVACGAREGMAAELLVGAATTSITPDRPVALSGQMNTRVARTVDNPVTATALALESRAGGKLLDQAILVSCDLVYITREVSEATRAQLRKRLPDFPAHKLVLSATHTHTAPVMEEGIYVIPAGVMAPREYVAFLAERVAETAAKAWKERQPGSVGWGLGHAVVAQNRRAVLANGQTVMYGRTDNPEFRGLEGHSDDGVEVLFFWDREKRLLATAVNVSCPAQEVEGLSSVNADFWHEVRTTLRQKHGKGLCVLAWTGAAGDQSPHLMYRKPAEERMRQLRGQTRLGEIARRVVRAWEEAYEGASKDIRSDVPLVHKVQMIELPRRKVTEPECREAREAAAALVKSPELRAQLVWNRAVVERFEQQQRGPLPPYLMELHVLRLGDVAIATNDFELFTDYGVQMRARSRALQTFLLQLSGPGTYLPTERAMRGGGYSAVVQSTEVGPAGGMELVERTVGLINSLWPDR